MAIETIDTFALGLHLDFKKVSKDLAKVKKQIETTKIKGPSVASSPGVVAGGSSVPKPGAAFSPGAVAASGAVASNMGKVSGHFKSIAGVGAGLAVVSFLSDIPSQLVAIDKQLIAVQKTTELTDEELSSLSKSIRGVTSAVKGVEIKRLLEYAEVAGTMGIKGVKDINNFSASMAKLELSSNLAGQAGAQSVARILTITKTDLGDFDRVASVITKLGNDFATTEAQIAETARRMASAGSAFNITAAEAAGLGAVMDSLGTDSALAGSVFSRTLGLMTNKTENFTEIMGKTEDQLKDMVNKNGTDAFVEFIKKLGEAKENGQNLFEIMDGLGIKENRLQTETSKLALSYKEVSKAVLSARKEFLENSALSREAAAAGNSLSAKIIYMKEQFVGLTTVMANAGAFDAIGRLAIAVGDMARLVASVPPEFWQLAGSVASVVIGMKVLGKVASTVIGSKFFGSIVKAGIMIKRAGGIVAGLRIAFMALRVAISANPIGLLINAGIILFSAWRPIVSLFSKTYQWIKKIANLILPDWLKGLFRGNTPSPQVLAKIQGGNGGSVGSYRSQPVNQNSIYAKPSRQVVGGIYSGKASSTVSQDNKIYINADGANSSEIANGVRDGLSKTYGDLAQIP